MSSGARRQVGAPDRDTQAWWDATRGRQLRVQRCRDCGHAQHYPRALCTACGGDALEMAPTRGTGLVETFTVVHRAPYEGLHPPYVVGLVRLAEGPQLLTNIVGCAPEDVRCGMPVAVTWERLEDGRHLPVFSPDREE